MGTATIFRTGAAPLGKIVAVPILFGMDIAVSYSVIKSLRRIDAL